MLDVDQEHFLTFPGFLKATPREEGSKRFVYIEASKETKDLQGEKVLAKALSDSADAYAQFGNVDLDHVSVTGARRGIPNPYLYEIGHPVEVRADGMSTFVKAAIFQGDTPVAAHANSFWDSVTKVVPPKRWYPSIGGQVLSRGVEYEAITRQPVPVITGVRWSNIGLSQTPVNTDVPGVSTVPIGLLAKSFGAGGHLAISLKALDAAGSSDSAMLTGGAALREQSLDRGVQSYWDFKDRVASDLRADRCGGSASAIVDHAHRTYGVAKAQGSEWTERFLSDLRAGLKKRMH